MTLIELKNSKGVLYLYDFDSGWEIYDKGEEPAMWNNYREGRNLDATQTYADLKNSFRSQMLPSAIQIEKF